MSQKKKKELTQEEELKQDITNFNVQIQQLTGARNYAQFILAKIEKKEKNGT